MARTGFQTKRLKKWAEELKALRPTKTKQFDMGAFRYNLYKEGGQIIGFTNNVDDAGNPLEKSCGFAACAVGWLPNFFPRNFKIADVHDDVSDNVEDKVVEFFGLQHHEYNMIVYPENYRGMTESITPKMAAARILEVIAGNHDDGEDFDNYYEDEDR